MDSVRIDRWLTAVRLFKTRSAAADACTGGKVRLNGNPVKSSSAVRLGDRIEARIGTRERVVVVERLIEKRVGAAIAAECFADHSPPPPPREVRAAAPGVREAGAGRPTKRDRRQIERLRGRRSR